MASCITSEWVSTAPNAKLNVVIKSETETTATLEWTAYYIAESPASAGSRDYNVKVNGSTVKSGSYNINGKKGTYTLASGTVTISKSTTSKSISFSISFAFQLTWSGVYRGTLTANGSITVGAKKSYSIKYNENGGLNAPASQTKWHGINITLSDSKPTKKGYTFAGWSTENDSTVEYQPGQSYASNANLTLYAVWELAYIPPKITNLRATRCRDLEGTPDEIGKYAKITFDWETSQLIGANNVKTIVITWGSTGTATVEATGIKGSVSKVVGNDDFSTDSSYSITVKVTDSTDGYTTKNVLLSGTRFLMDRRASGDGISFGAPAVRAGADFFMNAYFNKPAEFSAVSAFNENASFKKDVLLKNGEKPYQFKQDLGANINLNNVQDEGIYHQNANANTNVNLNYPVAKAGMLIVYKRVSMVFQIYITYTGGEFFYRNLYGGAWKAWARAENYKEQKTLWSGALFMHENHTINLSEAISKQSHGVVLIWGWYKSSTEEVIDQNFISSFIPKEAVRLHPGKGFNFLRFTTTFSYAAGKYIHIYDTKMVGDAANNDTGTGTTGVKYSNNLMVLREVIGV